MKAAFYMGKQHIEVRELSVPTLGKNDVLIQNIYSSICGTDVAVYKYGEKTGHRITIGEEFGHETISRIVATGKNVSDFTIGERVYPYPLYAKGDSKRAGTIGGFSEYILIPNAKRNHSLYAVNDKISDKTACLIEPFTVGCRAARRGQPKSGEKAVVFGCGTIGIAVAIALQYFGIDKVMVCDISDFRLSIAKNLGFLTCNVSKKKFLDTAKKQFGEAFSLNGSVPDIDLFIDAAGTEYVLQSFMEIGKFESRFVTVAVNKNIRDIDLLHMTYSSKSIIGSGGYMPEDVGDVLKIMESGKWNIEAIITHEFPLSEIEMAIQTAADVTKSFNVVINFLQ